LVSFVGKKVARPTVIIDATDTSAVLLVIEKMF
jgi:hypothetical protein